MTNAHLSTGERLGLNPDEHVLMFEATHCDQCGEENYGFRAGCRCMPMDDLEKLAGYTVTYGFMTCHQGHDKFVSLSEIKGLVDKGEAVRMHDSGELVDTSWFEDSEEAS